MDREIGKVLVELKSSRSNVRYGALITLRKTFIKSKEAINKLLQDGCIDILLRLLKNVNDQKNTAKTTDIILSILANLCLEDIAREQVIAQNGISTLAEIVMASEQESIHNRGIRAISNVAQHLPNCDVIFQLKIPAFVAKRLRETEDKECMSTFLRSLRILGQTSGNIKKLADESMALSAVACILKKDDKKLNMKSLQILNDMSSVRCCPAFAEEVLAANVLEELVTFAEDTDSRTTYLAFSIILRLADHSRLRPPLGNAGAISLFMREMGKSESQMNLIFVLNALCMCSREAVNRQKLYEINALDLFISYLDIGGQVPSRESKFSLLHDRLISSLVNFLYDDRSMTKLLKLDVVNILMQHLHRVCDLEIVSADLDKQVNILGSLAERSNAETSQTNDIVETFHDENVNCTVKFQLQDVEKEDEPVEILDSTVAPPSVEKETFKEAIKPDVDTYAELPQLNEIQSEIPIPKEDLDEEVMNIVSNREESQASSSKHTFSINSPTYQIGQSSWNIQNYSSGVTCKSFITDSAAGIAPIPFHPGSENQDMAPFSPLSGGASYYSPAYSPSYSVGLSPNYSPNPHASPSSSRGPSGSLGSPTWSLTSSDRLSPIDGNRLSSPPQNAPGSSPSYSNLQAPFSPLSITFPTTSLQESFGDDHEPQSPVFNSQMSLLSHSETPEQGSPVPDLNSSQENNAVVNAATAFEREPSFMRELSSKGVRKYEFSIVPLSQEEELIYSASEDDVEEEDKEEKESEKREVCQVQDDCRQNTQASSLSLCQEIALKRSLSLPASSMEISSEKDTGELCMESNQTERFSKRLKLDETTPQTAEDIIMDNKKFSVKTGSEDLFDSSQQENSIQRSGVAKKRDDLVSHPFYRGWWKQPSHFATTSASSSLKFLHSPHRSLSPGPSLSPFSRHGMSPLASLSPFRSPYHDSGTNQSLGDSPKIEHVMPSASPLLDESKTPQRDASSSLGCLREEMSTNPLDTSSTNATCSRPSAPTTTNATHSATSHDHSSERLQTIMKKSESNIMILLSRISVKGNPSQYLVQPQIFSTLLCYLSHPSNQQQRCFRLLSRVCNNSLCFQPLLLIQGPALIIRYLIQEPDGSFPSVLFSSESRGRQCRQISPDDIISSSQNSDTASSQVSEFGRRMEFEFGGDAYCSMMMSSPGTIFRQHPSLSSESQSAQDGSSTPGHLESSSHGKKARIQMGMRLLRAVSSLALSRYGDGEVRRILARGSSQEKLQCTFSLLHLLITCGSFSRHQLLSKASFEEVIPFLFVPEAPAAREAIVTAISLYTLISGITKTVPQKSNFVLCPDISDTIIQSHVGEAKDREMDRLSDAGFDIRGDPEKKKSPLLDVADPETSTGSGCIGFQPANNSSCVYTTLSSDFDVSLIIINQGSKEVFKAHKATIMKKSFYFSNLLGSNYAEANKKEVTLKNISIPGFEYIIHYLHGCLSGCPTIDTIPLEIKPNEEGSIVSTQISMDSEDDNSEAANDDITTPRDISTDRPQCAATTSTASDVCSGNDTPFKPFSSSCDMQINSSESAIDKPSTSVAATTSNALRKTSNFNCDASFKVSFDCRTKGYCSPGQNKNTSASAGQTNISRSDLDNTGDTSLSINAQQGNPTSLLSLNAENTLEESLFRQVDCILDKCEHVLAVADQFVLKELVDYITSVLSHVCLFPHTCEFIFGLACFYQMNDLIFDCVAEIVSSPIPRTDVSAFIIKMGENGYREIIENVLHRMISPSS